MKREDDFGTLNRQGQCRRPLCCRRWCWPFPTRPDPITCRGDGHVNFDNWYEDMIGYVHDSIWFVYDLGWSGFKIERQPNIALTFNKQIWKIETGMMDLESHNSARLISSFGWGAPKVGLVNGSWGHYSISNHTDIMCDILWHSTWSETCVW